MIKAGIIGAAGYTAGELIRILIHHPKVEIAYLQSESQSGKKVADVHRDLVGESTLVFQSEIEADVDVVFLCKGHGESKKILEEYPDLFNTKLIDLSQDYRLSGAHDFVYGLPELNKEAIKDSNHVANPGCFATCIQLGLLPAVANRTIAGGIHTSGITGSTGAGQSLSETSHFSWRSNNASVYKPLKHQHLNEIGENILSMDDVFDHSIQFIPYRGAFTRGIITTSCYKTEATNEELISLYKAFYQQQPFTHVVDDNPDVKMVVNTNKCLVFPQVIDDTAVVISVIDNLLKGASGQAIQNMNLMFDLEESEGLKLKSTVF